MLLDVFGTEQVLDETSCRASDWPDWTPGGGCRCSWMAVFGQIILYTEQSLTLDGGSRRRART
jgi:hypothetical protein